MYEKMKIIVHFALKIDICDKLWSEIIDEIILSSIFKFCDKYSDRLLITFLFYVKKLLLKNEEKCENNIG